MLFLSEAMAVNVTSLGYNWFKRQRIFHWSLSVLSLVTLLFISGKYPLKFPEFWNKNFFVLILSLLLLSRFLRQCHQCVFVKITNFGPKNATFSEKSTTTFKKAPWKPLLWRYINLQIIWFFRQLTLFFGAQNVLWLANFRREILKKTPQKTEVEFPEAVLRP